MRRMVFRIPVFLSEAGVHCVQESCVFLFGVGVAAGAVRLATMCIFESFFLWQNSKQLVLTALCPFRLAVAAPPVAASA